MADRFTAEQRSALMSRIRGKNTSPEIKVRRLVHALGFRFRLHRRDLPGSPDLVFPRLRKVILVHGCFWHRHHGCALASEPKSRTAYWENKFARNIERDKQNQAALAEGRWQVMVVWECDTRSKDLGELAGRLSRFLNA